MRNCNDNTVNSPHLATHPVEHSDRRRALLVIAELGQDQYSGTSRRTHDGQRRRPRPDPAVAQRTAAEMERRAVRNNGNARAERRGRDRLVRHLPAAGPAICSRATSQPNSVLDYDDLLSELMQVPELASSATMRKAHACLFCNTQSTIHRVCSGIAFT